MDFIGRRLGCSLAVVCGLIFFSPSVFAASGVVFPTNLDAEMACLNYYNLAATSRSSGSGLSCDPPWPDITCVRPSGSKFFVAFVGYKSIEVGQCQRVPGHNSILDSISYTYSGYIYNDVSTIRFDFLEEEDPEPECPDYTAPEFSGWMAPTPNGTGYVCLNGCVASIALSPPPGPLFVGQWTGDSCPVDNALPVGEHTLPDDPEAPGTDTPSDPNAPDGTGGGGFTCDAPPVCKADGITCSALYQQWRTRCDAQISHLEAGKQRDAIIDGLEGIRDGLDSGLDRIGDGIDGVNDRLDGTNNRLDGTNQRLDAIGGKLDGIGNGINGLGSRFGDVFGDGPVGDDWLGGMPTRDVVLDSSKLDDSGMGLSRTCPAVLTNSTSFSFFGNQYTLKFDMFCAMLELVGQLLVVLAAFVGVRILLKSATG